MSGARLIALFTVLLLGSAPASLDAQTVEVSPFLGYRFGGDLYELSLGRTIDSDAAPSFGVAVDVFVDRRASVSFLYSRQEEKVDPTWVPGAGRAVTRLAVEHWHGGGTYELGWGAVRPFLAGSIGLTRFGSPADSEVRFSAAGGGGVKLMPSRHVGVRFDGRLYAVFVDGRLGTVVCSGGCLVDLDLFVLWQAEFTTAFVISF